MAETSSDTNADTRADHTSVWLDRPRAPHPPLQEDRAYDVAVVGGGLTGLLTGLLVARSGLSVVVLEARQVADGATGNTTAKVSLLQGTKLSRALASSPPSAVRSYVEANREGQAWLARFCDDHGVATQTRPAYTFATTRLGEMRAQAELSTARLTGLDVSWETETELPFPVRGAVRLADQLQLHAMDLVDAIVSNLISEGGDLYERTRVVDVRRLDRGAEVVTETATVTARHVVLATNQPILLRHGFFAREKANRSYAAAFTSPWTPHGMYLSSDPTTQSLRSLPVPGGDELLLVGGYGHPTGRSRSPQRHLDRLVQWARSTFSGSSLTHTWSAQDQATVTGLPYVGPMLPRDRTVLLATGFDKWGFTNAPAAALLLAKTILERTVGGEKPRWGGAFATWSPREVAGAPRTAVFNAEVGAQMAAGVAKRMAPGREALVCSHLQGVVRWNDAEQSWDCPLHGSRFTVDGDVLDGPAICGLRKA